MRGGITCCGQPGASLPCSTFYMFSTARLEPNGHGKDRHNRSYRAVWFTLPLGAIRHRICAILLRMPSPQPWRAHQRELASLASLAVDLNKGTLITKLTDFRCALSSPVSKCETQSAQMLLCQGLVYIFRHQVAWVLHSRNLQKFDRLL